MRVAYADPPYPGQARRHYRNHADYGGEVDHQTLIHELLGFDGYCLHTSSPALGNILSLFAAEGETPRVMAWVKPFAAFKANIPVAYAWEPILVKACRTPTVDGPFVMRDYISEPITMQRGLAGVKPERVCCWLFEVMALQPDDELVDLYPGSGAVQHAWDNWQLSLGATA